MASEQGKKGFAGLDSLVTKVDAAPSPTPPPEETSQAPKSMSAPPRQVYTGTPTAGSKSGGTVGWWLMGLTLLVAIIYFSNSDNSSPSSASYQASSAPVQSTPATGQNYSSNEETMPLVGDGLAFDRSEIRYCLSQEIRIAAWQGQVNQYSQSSVDAFNGAVADYNARCAHYRYRDGDLENVRSQVETNRAELVQQGMSQAANNQ